MIDMKTMKKVLIILMCSLLVIGIVGCAEEKFKNIPDNEKETYQEVYKLYQYANKMIDDNMTFQDMMGDDSFKIIFKKYVNNTDNLNEPIKSATINILGAIVICEGEIEDYEIAKTQLDKVKKLFK